MTASLNVKIKLDAQFFVILFKIVHSNYAGPSLVIFARKQ